MGFLLPPEGGKRGLFGLAPGGVCQATLIAQGTGELLPRLFTLTHQGESLGARSLEVRSLEFDS